MQKGARSEHKGQHVFDLSGPALFGYTFLMKTTVVCGLLGAGKTTFIQGILKTAGEKTVVLVNDFGKAGIDGEIISAAGIETIELPSGCVCCVLRFDLITTIQKVLKDFSPEHLIIEPSGVASVSGILEILEIIKLSPVTVVGIIDSTEFLELYESGVYGSFFEDQIVNSDLLLVNKTDLVGNDITEKTVNAVEQLNHGALIFRTVQAGFSDKLPASRRDSVFKSDTPFHFTFDTISIPLERIVDTRLLQGLFSEMAAGTYGNIVRAKALISTDGGPFRFDFSYGRTTSAPLDKPVFKGRLVIIGDGLKKDLIMAQFEYRDLLLKENRSF